MTTANRYPQSQILACWYTHSCQSVWESGGFGRKVFCSGVGSGLHWWTTKCCNVLQWKVKERSGTGSSIHSVHSTFVDAVALTWKCRLHIVLIQACLQSQMEL